MSMFTRSTVRSAAAITVLAAALSLGACAKAGADTTCKDFLKMSESDQNQQVVKLYKDKHDSEPAAAATTGLRTEAVTYCSTVGKPDTKIKEIPIS